MRLESLGLVTLPCLTRFLRVVLRRLYAYITSKPQRWQHNHTGVLAAEWLFRSLLRVEVRLTLLLEWWEHGWTPYPSSSFLETRRVSTANQTGVAGESKDLTP